MKLSNIKIVLFVFFISFSTLLADTKIQVESKKEKPVSANLSRSNPIQKDYVSGIYQWQYLNYHHNVNLFLKNAPYGMKLDSSNRLLWTAPESAETQSFDVILSTKENSSSEPLKFQVKVATTSAINKNIYKNTLTLVDDDCKFNTIGWGNFSVTSNIKDINKLYDAIFRKVISDVDFHIPRRIHRLSCYFRAQLMHQKNSGDDYTITLPINLEALPEGYPVETIKLYTYEPSQRNATSQAWQKKSIMINSKQTEQGNFLEFNTSSLPNRLYFIGYEDFDTF